MGVELEATHLALSRPESILSDPLYCSMTPRLEGAETLRRRRRSSSSGPKSDFTFSEMIIKSNIKINFSLIPLPLFTLN